MSPLDGVYNPNEASFHTPGSTKLENGLWEVVEVKVGACRVSRMGYFLSGGRKNV